MINKIVFILAALLLAEVQATSTIQSIRLDKESAKKLGFDLELTSEKQGKYVSLSGPEVSNEGCKPSKTGSFTIDDEGKDISGFIADVSGVKKPHVFGYVDSNSENSAVIFIDYLCTGMRKDESRRYEVSTTQI